MSPVEQYVLANWKRKTVKMMAKKSNFKEYEIRAACKKLDIDPISEKDFKISVVLNNHKKYSASQIAEKFNMSIHTVFDICKEWGVKCLSEKERSSLEAEKFLAKFKSRQDAYLAKEFCKKYRENIERIIKSE
jgi:signal recognition particle subunit SEC65